MKIFTKDYTMRVAGGEWEFKDVTFYENLDGRILLDLHEQRRLTGMIVSELVKPQDTPMTLQEYDFLCRKARISHAESSKFMKLVELRSVFLVEPLTPSVDESNRLREFFKNRILTGE